MLKKEVMELEEEVTNKQNQSVEVGETLSDIALVPMTICNGNETHPQPVSPDPHTGYDV